MSPETKNTFAGIGAVLGLVAGISLGAWLVSGWEGGIGQNIGHVLLLGFFGLGVVGGIGWFVGTTIQNPIVGVRLLIMVGIAILAIVLQMLFALPMVVVTIIATAAGILLWRTTPKAEAE